MKKFFQLALLFLSLAAAARAQDLAFIAHPDVADSSFSADDISSILLGKKTSWSSGPLRLAVLTEGPVHDAVMKTYAQRTADQFDKHWKKLVFTGKGIFPLPVKTDAEMLAYVAKTPGAFGYLARASVTAQVKVIVLR